MAVWSDYGPFIKGLLEEMTELAEVDPRIRAFMSERPKRGDYFLNCLATQCKGNSGADSVRDSLPAFCQLHSPGPRRSDRRCDKNSPYARLVARGRRREEPGL
jgi:hypothetical protein